MEEFGVPCEDITKVFVVDYTIKTPVLEATNRPINEVFENKYFF